MKGKNQSSPWKPTKLNDVCLEITVGHVGPMASQYLEDGIPFLRSQNIEPFRLNRQDVKYISPDFHQKLKKSALKPGDVAVVRTGYPGTACVIPQNLPIANCADLVIIRPSKSINSHFLVALFNSTWGKGIVAGNLVGVAQQHFNVGAAKDMTINLPPIESQRKIASILSAYDDLIENNSRRIAILEEMAQAIYREWFVHFRFPGHEKVKLVDSPMGKIPEGWKAGILGDMVAFNNGKSVKPGGEGCYAVYGSNGAIGYSNSFQFPNGIIIGRVGAYCGSIAYSLKPFRASDNTIVALPKDDEKRLFPYVLYLLKEMDLHRFSGGAAQPLVTQGVLKTRPVAVPSQALRDTFSDFASGILQHIECLECKIDNLRKTRDLLLPKLISGQLDVEELDIEIGETLAEAQA